MTDELSPLKKLQHNSVIIAISSGNGRGSTTLAHRLVKDLLGAKVSAKYFSLFGVADSVLENSLLNTSPDQTWRSKSTEKFVYRELRYRIVYALQAAQPDLDIGKLRITLAQNNSPLASKHVDVFVVDDLRFMRHYLRLRELDAFFVRIEADRPKAERDEYAAHCDDYGPESTDLDRSAQIKWDVVLGGNTELNARAEKVIGTLGVIRKARQNKTRA